MVACCCLAAALLHPPNLPTTHEASDLQQTSKSARYRCICAHLFRVGELKTLCALCAFGSSRTRFTVVPVVGCRPKRRNVPLSPSAPQPTALSPQPPLLSLPPA